MTEQEEDRFIHTLLAELSPWPNQEVALDDLLNKLAVPPDARAKILHRLQLEHLVRVAPSKRGRSNVICLSTQGAKIALSYGGYKAFRGKLLIEQQAQIDKENLDRAAAQATVTGAEAAVSAARAAWVAVGVSLLSLALSIIAIWQANNK